MCFFWLCFISEIGLLFLVILLVIHIIFVFWFQFVFYFVSCTIIFNYLWDHLMSYSFICEQVLQMRFISAPPSFCPLPSSWLLTSTGLVVQAGAPPHLYCGIHGDSLSLWLCFLNLKTMAKHMYHKLLPSLLFSLFQCWGQNLGPLIW